MNDSDDELISSIAVDDEEEEDWNDTGWAQPPSNTGKVALSINFRKMVDTGEKGPGGRVWLPQQDNQDENTVPVKHHRELEDLGIKAEVSHHDHLKALKESIAGSGETHFVYIRYMYLRVKSAVRPVLCSPSKIDKTIVLKTSGSLVQVKSIAECSTRALLKVNTFNLH